MGARTIDGAEVQILVGDLVALDVDAIVNAANDRLLAGGGVCGAIFRAAGHRELQEACDHAAPCPTGQARLTPGFGLKARWIIHAVGPVWSGGSANEAELLASAYRCSLRLAADRQLASIAFPAISTGIYGYPMDRACEVATNAVASELRDHPSTLRRVVFVLRDGDGARLYEDALARL